MASAWLNQVFSAGSVNKGNIVRRQQSSVKKYSSEKDLVAEVKARGFHLIKTGDQYIIICNSGKVELVV